MTSSMDQASKDAKSLLSHNALLRNKHISGNSCFVPSARDIDEISYAQDPSLVPYGFDRARKSNDLGSRCTKNRCLCCCHQQAGRSWGYLHLFHTQSSSIRAPCNRTSCKVRSLKTTAAVDLSWMRVRLALIASLEVFWGLGCFSIKPSLEMKRVVPPDSKGFTISKKLQNGEYNAADVLEELLKAFRKGEASLMDVTPDGWSLTESMMEITSLEAAQESCWNIIYLLKTLAGQNAVMECLPAFFKFCETAFVFGGIDPFDIVNALGIVYEVADEDILGFHRIIYERNDPFGIRWLQKCLRKCPGFANIPPLIQKVLLDDVGTVTHTETASAHSINETLLGRSVLHWATCSESWVRCLLDAGHCVSPIDQSGRPPLIYAAAYGLLGSLSALLEAGADPTSGYEWSFLRYAMYHGHIHIVFGSIDFFRRDSVGRFDIAQTLLDQALRIWCRYLNYAGPWVPYYVNGGSEKSATVEKLLMLGANPDLFQNDGDNLLHQSRISGMVSASLILGAGTRHINVGNATGETPAMRAAYKAQASLLHLYLQNGAGLQRRDNYGRNIVHYAMVNFHRDLSWAEPDGLFWKHSNLKTLLSYNVDVNVGDYCRCACSLNGCTPSTLLLKQLFSRHQPYIRPSGLASSIEWLLLLQELVSYNAAERAFAELGRFLLFQVSGLTHVCCRPSVYRASWWQESPIDQEDISEILDEERELIVTLEEDLEKLTAPLDQRDPVEAWADMLTDFAKEHDDLVRSSDRAKTPFRHALLHYREETGGLLRAVYQDDATFFRRLKKRQALIRRCLDRLKAK
jgi:ankyrin repeat protein